MYGEVAAKGPWSEIIGHIHGKAVTEQYTIVQERQKNYDWRDGGGNRGKVEKYV